MQSNENYKDLYFAAKQTDDVDLSLDYPLNRKVKRAEVARFCKRRFNPIFRLEFFLGLNKDNEPCKTRVRIQQPFSRKFLVFFSKVCKCECNTTSDWLNHTV